MIILNIMRYIISSLLSVLYRCYVSIVNRLSPIMIVYGLFKMASQNEITSVLYVFGGVVLLLSTRLILLFLILICPKTQRMKMYKSCEGSKFN